MKRATLAVATLLSVSCAATPSSVGDAESPRPSPAPTTSTSSPPPRLADPDEGLRAKIEDALAYVAEVRHLAAKSPVQGRSIARAEIARFIQGEIDREAPADVVPATEALLHGFGTVEADFDYRQSLISLMQAQLLGFYDPRQKTFFVGGDLSGEEADATLWHELVHALQDQHYGLEQLTTWKPDLGDSQAAGHALAEGDATSAMLDAVMKPRGVTALDLPEGLLRAESVLGTIAGTAPPILVRSLVAPYVDGLAFTNALRRRGGFAEVDAAWRAPPVSTEQVLHPEKYWAGEAPLAVDLPVAPPHLPGFAERFHDVMGEQGLRVLLEEWLPAATAATAASDWGGDRIAVFSDEARQVWAVGWHLRFDSDAAAERAYAAWARSLPLTEPQGPGAPRVPPPKAPPGRELCRERHTRGPIALVRRGADLAVTLGPWRRNPVAVTRDPGCQAAVTWARAVLK